ncbi:MAG TPA: TlyA family RNA methyltransferase [Vicinamibacterales bacterium]|nr:TlyA family RNA methyltransferase [Vicinamibacterales bacterium]HPW20541.1 TlyA family RNA methyltransferase [Vicinamibacterales bacterium]
MPARRRLRLDAALVERGLAASRERARALVLAGRVRVSGAVVSKAGTAVPGDAPISVDEPDFPWVGRGGVKLAHALDVFRIDVAGREALDIGASTGGFTDVLLRRGAARVVALDVGHGQIDSRLRADPRVVVLERRNARALAPGWLPAPAGVVTIDVSFISLRLILPALPPVLADGADIVALVKPQFEAGRGQVGRGGLVRDPAVHEAVIERVTAAAAGCGLRSLAMTPSPITGASGNVEFLLHLRRQTPDPDAPPGRGGVA